MNIVERVARANWRPPSRVPPWRWAEENLTVDRTSPFPGPFRSETAPWTKEPMECFADNRIRDISIMCSAQSSKTQTIIICLCWALAEDPGAIMWVMAAHDEAKTFARTRLMPTLRSVEAIRQILPKRFEVTNLEINFPNAPLVLNGANSESKLQSKPIRWLFLDEVRNYPAGAYEMVLKRTTAFWNARRVTISTPKDEGDHVDRAFQAGDQRHYYFPCPKCEFRQRLIFDRLRYEEDLTTRPGGEWNFDALAKTIRYECEQCSHPIIDNAASRRFIAQNGIWIPHNKRAPVNHVSFTWSALLPPWIRWRSIIEEWLKAQEAWALGAEEPRKAFVNETLGEPWSQHAVFEREIKPSEGYKLSDLEPGAKWEREHIRFMTVDKQKASYWFVIRAWAKDAASRLIAFGEVRTWDEVRAIQLQYKVFDRCTIVDTGYLQNEVFDKLCEYGWTGFKGEDQVSFPWTQPGGIIRHLPFSKLQVGIAGLGRSTGERRACPWFFWSNPTIKDQLFRLKSGKGVPWEVGSDVSEIYLKHMCSEARVREVNKRTGYTKWIWKQIGSRPNHGHDCECMQVVCALKANLMPAITGQTQLDNDALTGQDTPSV